MKNLDNVTNVWGKVDERRHEVLEVSVQGMRNRWPLGFPLVKFRNAAGEEYAHSFKDDMQSNKVRVELNDRDVKRAGVCVLTVEWHEKGRVVASREYMGLIEGKKMEKPKYEVIGGEEDCGGGNGGGGLPEGGEPFKQLVTNGSGETVWEDRLAYKTGATYAYDGVTEGKDTFEWNGTFVKISDDLLTEEQLAMTYGYNDGKVYFNGQSLAELPHFSNETVYHDMMFGGICICYSTHIVVSNGKEYDVPSTGIYIDAERFGWVTWKWGSVKPIDPEYIPEEIPRKDDLTWDTLGKGDSLTFSYDGNPTERILFNGGDAAIYMTYSGSVPTELFKAMEISGDEVEGFTKETPQDLSSYYGLSATQIKWASGYSYGNVLLINIPVGGKAVDDLGEEFEVKPGIYIKGGSGGSYSYRTAFDAHAEMVNKIPEEYIPNVMPCVYGKEDGTYVLPDGSTPNFVEYAKKQVQFLYWADGFESPFPSYVRLRTENECGDYTYYLVIENAYKNISITETEYNEIQSALRTMFGV